MTASSAIDPTRSRPNSTVQASGQLALIYFQGVGEGSADLSITDLDLHGADSQPIPFTVVNGNIQVQGNDQPQQPTPGTGNGNDDNDED